MRISNEEMMTKTDLPFHLAPPYRIKVVEYPIPTTREKRKEIMKQYGYSGRLLPVSYTHLDVYKRQGWYLG